MVRVTALAVVLVPYFGLLQEFGLVFSPFVIIVVLVLTCYFLNGCMYFRVYK